MESTARTEPMTRVQNILFPVDFSHLRLANLTMEMHVVRRMVNDLYPSCLV
jgi:hypothetical protein